jgi:hypothetical protein
MSERPKLVVLGPDLVVYDDGTGAPRFVELSAALDLMRGKEEVIVGVGPLQIGALNASERTLDAVLADRMPAAHTMLTELLGPNFYQAFAIEDELFTKLRGLAKTVRVVPYAAAVRHVLRSRLSTGAKAPLSDAGDAGALVSPRREGEGRIGECVVLEPVSAEFLLTALRDDEVLAVRRVRGGDPIVEFQRTLAASRMGNPAVLCVDPELAEQLKTRGYAAEPIGAAGSMVGWKSLDEVADFRFLSTQEIARARSLRGRARAIGITASAFGALVLAAGAYGLCHSAGIRAAIDRDHLVVARDVLKSQVSELVAEKHAAVAAASSVRIHRELFDLLLSLPPQVKIISLEKDRQGDLTLLLERRADAAPFGRKDLVAALEESAHFRSAEIREEYLGHIIRYELRVRASGRGPGG